MQVEWSDRFTPAAAGLVSRAWIIRAVGRHAPDPVTRARWTDLLLTYEPPRRHALRNNFVFWLTAIGASALAGALGLPPWSGFVAVVLLFLWLARVLAVRALEWRLQQLIAGSHGVATSEPG